MIIRLAQKNESWQIAEIHKKEIKKGFLSSLKKSFLEKLYSAIIESQFSFCIVAQEKDQVIGFVAGTTNIDKLYSYFLKKYFFQSVFVLLPKIFSFKSLKKIFETLFYPQKEKKLPKAEFLTIALKKGFQGQEIGSQMLQKFILEMKSKKVEVFKVIVGEELKPAIKFYEKNGFQFLKNITIHGEQPSRVYIYEVR
ncbi:unnamed protein product [marine sediment metagenome]|uniref:N-acetyltransferase domain-containing protein n=1 Tax=marine sediment metagenome TaxID=412755 RepID=X1K604_9ZZZZ